MSVKKGEERISNDHGDILVKWRIEKEGDEYAFYISHQPIGTGPDIDWVGGAGESGIMLVYPPYNRGESYEEVFKNLLTCIISVKTNSPLALLKDYETRKGDLGEKSDYVFPCQ